MDENSLTDDQIESLLTGGPTPPGHEDLAGVFGDLRATARVDVPVRPQLGEFVAAPPTAPPYVDDLPPVPPPAVPAPLQRPVWQRPLARLALAAGIGIAGVTGAHAAGIVDVPGLPDGDNPAEVVLANTPPVGLVDEGDSGGSDPGSQAPAALQDANDGGEAGDQQVDATVGFGDLEVKISISNAGDPESFTVSIDVEGVSPECEAALESLSGTYTDSTEVDAAAADAEAACEADFELAFGDLDGIEDFDRFLEEFDFSLELPDDLGSFFGEDFEQFGRFGDFDLDELERMLENFDFEEFEQYLDGFDLEKFEGFGDFDFENLDPGELESFLESFGLENFDPSELESFLDGFDFDSFNGFDLEGFDASELESFLDGFDPSELESFLEGFDGVDPGRLGELWERFETGELEGVVNGD